MSNNRLMDFMTLIKTLILKIMSSNMFDMLTKEIAFGFPSENFFSS